MWVELVGAVLGLAGVLAAANVLVGDQARRRRKLRDELELLELLEKASSDLPEQATLAALIDESVALYVDHERHRQLSLRQLQFRAWATLGVMALGALTGITAGVALTFHDGPQWLTWAHIDPRGWLAVSLAALGYSAMLVANVQLGRLHTQIALRKMATTRAIAASTDHTTP